MESSIPSIHIDGETTKSSVFQHLKEGYCSHSKRLTRCNTNAMARGSQDDRSGGRCHHLHPRFVPSPKCYSVRGSDLKDRIMAKLETWIPRSWLSRCEDLLDDVNAIPTALIIETNKLIYSTAAVIREMLGYRLNSHKKETRG